MNLYITNKIIIGAQVDVSVINFLQDLRSFRFKVDSDDVYIQFNDIEVKWPSSMTYKTFLATFEREFARKINNANI